MLPICENVERNTLVLENVNENKYTREVLALEDDDYSDLPQLEGNKKINLNFGFLAQKC